MEPEGMKFGRGPRELTGAVDLLSRYKLLPQHEFFCKKMLPVSIVDSHYLHNVVGEAEIRKGDGMQLGQLIQGPCYIRSGNVHILPVAPHVLGEAFHLRETTPVELPSGEKGVPTNSGKFKSEHADKDKKHKKRKDRDKEKDKEHKKHKHQHKDQIKDKEKKKDKNVLEDSGVDHTKNHHGKNRDGDEDVVSIYIYKKSQHKSSKMDELDRIKIAG